MYRDILSSKKPTMTMVDDFAVNLRTGEVLTPHRNIPLPLLSIKNLINQRATGQARIGIDKAETARCINDDVQLRGPIGTGKYRCTCDNFGPRFLEDSLNGCCPGCFQWALDHHQEMSVNGVKPVTMEMIESSQSHGFNVAVIKKNKAQKFSQDMADEIFGKDPIVDDYIWLP